MGLDWARARGRALSKMSTNATMPPSSGTGGQLQATAPQGVKYICGDCGYENLLQPRVRSKADMILLKKKLYILMYSKSNNLTTFKILVIREGASSVQGMWISDSVQDANPEKYVLRIAPLLIYVI